jgi:hypothetical protein
VSREAVSTCKLMFHKIIRIGHLVFFVAYSATLSFVFSFLGWGETESTWYVGHNWPIVPAPGDR